MNKRWMLPNLKIKIEIDAETIIDVNKTNTSRIHTHSLMNTKKALTRTDERAPYDLVSAHQKNYLTG